MLFFEIQTFFFCLKIRKNRDQFNIYKLKK